MSQTDTDQQLRIWKDLAISKQMLMNEAANVLGLKSDCTAEELREALQSAVERSKSADANMAESRAGAEQQVTDMQQTVKKIEKARTEAENQRDAALAAQQQAEQQLGNGRKDNAEALKKAKRQVEEKQRELKAINVALADTPDNIVKKLKALKKQKLDESNGRKVAEDSNRKLKKETKQQKEELDKLESLAENCEKLLAGYRTLFTWAGTAARQLKEADIEIDDAPQVDDDVLADIDTVVARDDEATDTREAATA